MLGRGGENPTVFGITGEATFVHFLQSLSLNFKGLLVSVCQVSSVCLSQFPWTSKRWHTRVARIFRITPSDQASRSVRPAPAESTPLSMQTSVTGALTPNNLLLDRPRHGRVLPPRRAVHNNNAMSSRDGFPSTSPRSLTSARKAEETDGLRQAVPPTLLEDATALLSAGPLTETLTAEALLAT